MGPRHAGPGVPLQMLAQRCGGQLVGDGSIVISAMAALNDAAPGDIAFLANRRYRGQLATTRASAVIVAPDDAGLTALPKLVTENPYATYAKAAALLYPPVLAVPGINASASVSATAQVAASATIGAYVVVGERTRIGERAWIHAGCVIGDDCELGDDVVLYPRVVVYADTRIGTRSIVHAGVVLGADGFGMAEEHGRWLKVPQVGGVVIGTDVEIGANTTIDRGALGNTVLEDNVKLDNQIQIGHNCHIGAHTAIAGQAGVAGSTRIGRNCKIGGAAMIIGHIEIADGTVISGGTAVFDTIREPGVYTSVFPALPHREWKHVASVVRRLRRLAERVLTLERTIRHLGE